MTEPEPESEGVPADATDTGAFAFFSLEGDRFNGPGMPAVTTREVGFFRDAIYEIARQLWLERNPDRRYVPDGFDAAFDLRLTEVLPGSARPQLILPKPKFVDDATWSDWYEVYSEARDTLSSSVRRAKQHDIVPPRLTSRRAHNAIRKVGSSLHPDETAVVGHPSIAQRRARLDASTRDVLSRIEKQVDVPVMPTSMTLVGVITEYDGVRLSFDLVTDNGIAKCVLETFNEDLATFARDVLALDGVTAPDVSVEGETLDPNRRPLHLFNVHSIDIVRSVEEKSMVRRLEQLTDLEDGWWGPDSLAPDAQVVMNLNLVIADLVGMAIAVDLIPSSDGSVVVEMRRGSAELSAAIEPGGGMTLIRDDLETDELAEASVPFDPGGLIGFLRTGALG